MPFEPQARPEKRSKKGTGAEWSALVSILILLGIAVFLDVATGPVVSAAAFYVFPVAIAGWRLGGRAAIAVAIAAVALNAVTERMGRDQPLPEVILLASEALHSIIYLGVAFLSSQLRRQQVALTEQRDALEQLNREKEEEMQAARQLQKVLSAPPPQHPAVDIATFAEAARILGGDALNISLAPSGKHLAIAVADVSGKGSPAALAAAVLLGLLEDCPARYNSPAATLDYLNEWLVSRLPTGTFVTLLYLLLDLETGELNWSNAGHEIPWLLLNAGSTESQVIDCPGLSETQFPLGLFDNVTYQECHTQLRPNDRLFCYTDGMIDFRLPTGERFGACRLHEAVAQTAHLTCAEQGTAIAHQTMAAGVSIEDDVTFAVIGFRFPFA